MSVNFVIEDACEALSPTCFRSVASLVVSCTIFGIGIYWSYRMIRLNRRVVFEVIPMSFSMLQSLIEIIFSVYRNYFYLPFTHLFLIVLTYGLVCSSLLQLDVRIIRENLSAGKTKKYVYAGLVFFIGSVFVIYISALVVMPGPLFSCYSRFNVFWILMAISQICSSILSIITGRHILDLLVHGDERLSDAFLYRSKIKQIDYIIRPYTIATFLYLLADTIVWSRQDSEISCLDDYVYVANNIWGELIMFVHSMLALIPSFLLMNIYYVLPKTYTRSASAHVERYDIIFDKREDLKESILDGSDQ